MIQKTLLGCLWALCVCVETGAVDETSFEMPGFTIRVDGTGHLSGLIDEGTGHDYLSNAQPAPLLQIGRNRSLHRPSKMHVHHKLITLDFASCTVSIRAECGPSHLSFEVTEVDPPDGADLIVWGPFPPTIAECVGETVGVVRDSRFALGIQALNVKTLGGYPESDSDVMPMYSIFEGSDFADVDEKKRGKTLFRGNTARPTDFGSVLQAYTRDRRKDRIIENWGHEKYVAPAYDDGGVVGSRIGLFGCKAKDALDTIGAIELAEGLPHPEIDGVWGKRSPMATASYLIVGFGEETIDDAIALTRRAGLMYLYHGGPFETWGHFKLNAAQFPSGWAGLKRCVEKAKAQGVRLGVHTLSNFITTNDPYVTPVPDERLARVGAGRLTADIDGSATTIPIDDRTWFDQMKNNTLRTVMVGKELITYESVSHDRQPHLQGCARGAFGTAASAHAKGEAVAKLIDHGYRVFLADASLQAEMAATIARLFNETGLRQISFDGLEGCWASGMGQYARTLFVKKWFDCLSGELQGAVINDASNPGHYFWHIYTRMNWGEPWYAGFRESQTQYRLMNQAFYSRNLMPAMLGWFNMTPSTSLEDAEWLLARAAGFDAGFSLCTNAAIVDQNGMGDAILTAVGTWEEARLGGAFTDAQKARLQDVEEEFHLETVEPGVWNLHPVRSIKQRLEAGARPGERLSALLEIKNPGAAQDLQFIMQSVGHTTVSGLEVMIDNGEALVFPVTLESGQILKYTRNGEARLLDEKWNEQSRLKLDRRDLHLAEGTHTVRVRCRLTGGEKPALKIELRALGRAERVTASP